MTTMIFNALIWFAAMIFGAFIDNEQIVIVALICANIYAAAEMIYERLAAKATD